MLHSVAYNISAVDSPDTMSSYGISFLNTTLSTKSIHQIRYEESCADPSQEISIGFLTLDIALVNLSDKASIDNPEAYSLQDFFVSCNIL